MPASEAVRLGDEAIREEVAERRRVAEEARIHLFGEAGKAPGSMSLLDWNEALAAFEERVAIIEGEAEMLEAELRRRSERDASCGA